MKQRLLLTVICMIFFLFDSVPVSALDYDTVYVNIPVYGEWLTVKKATPSYSYKIVMRPVSDMAPEPQKGTLVLYEGGSVSFSVPVDQPGTFVYKVYETDTQHENIDADESVYDVMIYSEAAGGTSLITAVTIRRGAFEKPEQMKFDDDIIDNRPPYVETGTTSPDVTVYTDKTDKTDTTDGEEPPDPDTEQDPGAGMENDDDTIDDETETVTETTAETKPDETPEEEQKSPIEVIVENLITPKTGNITVASIIAIMGISLTVLAVSRKRDNDKDK